MHLDETLQISKLSRKVLEIGTLDTCKFVYLNNKKIDIGYVTNK